MDGSFLQAGAGTVRYFTDPDDLAETFESWDMRLTQLRSQDHPGWTIAGTVGELSFRSTSLTGSYRANASVPPRTVLVHLDLAPAPTRRLSGMRLGRDDLAVSFGGVELDYVLSGRHLGLGILIPEHLVTEALELRAPDVREQWCTSTPYVASCSAASGATLRSLARDAVQRSGLPAIGYHAAGDLFDALVDAIATRSQTDKPLRRPRLQRLPIVRRVEEYMRANIGAPIMLHDLCRAACASQRSVAYAFSEVYGMGPMQYLKLLRLNRVRTELKLVRGRATPIARIAHRFGFWHMGHFSEDYLRLFGELPSSTSAGEWETKKKLSSIEPMTGSSRVRE